MGTQKTIGSLRNTFNLVTGDNADVLSQSVHDSQLESTEDQDRLHKALQERMAQGDSGLWDGIKNVVGSAIEEPRGFFHEFVGQALNTAAIMATAGTGAYAGTVIGGIIGIPFGPAGMGVGAGVGRGVGALVGAGIGLFAGNVAIESGFIASEKAQDGDFTEADRREALEQGLTKGAVISAVDTATFGMSRLIMGIPGRAVERAISKSLTDNGIELTESAITKAATESPAAIRAAIEAGGIALQGAMSITELYAANKLQTPGTNTQILADAITGKLDGAKTVDEIVGIASQIVNDPPSDPPSDSPSDPPAGPPEDAEVVSEPPAKPPVEPVATEELAEIDSRIEDMEARAAEIDIAESPTEEEEFERASINDELADAQDERDAVVARMDAEKVAGRPEQEEAVEIDAKANEAATSPENDLEQPTEAQIEAGNSKLGHIKVSGFDISIENPRGSDREGVSKGGKAWKTTMTDHYGYIRRTKGADNEQIDVFVGEKIFSDKVFVVDQVDEDGDFDEHKVMMGYTSLAAATEAYKANYDDSWVVGPISEISKDQFRDWLAKGDNTQPFAESTQDTAEVQAESTETAESTQDTAQREESKRDRGERSSEEQSDQAEDFALDAQSEESLQAEADAVAATEKADRLELKKKRREIKRADLMKKDRIGRSDGTPFRFLGKAKQKLALWGLSDTHDIKKSSDGWVLVKKNTGTRWSASVIQNATHKAALDSKAVVDAAAIGTQAHREALQKALIAEIEKGLIDQKEDADAVAAYKELLGKDGDLNPDVFDAKYFDAAYRESFRVLEKEKKIELLAAWKTESDEAFADILPEITGGVDSVDAFKMGWDHAIGGGSASNIPTGGVDMAHHESMRDGYKRASILFHNRDAPATGKRVVKDDRTGVILRRMRDLKWDRDVTEEIKGEATKAIRKIFGAVSRAEAFANLLGDKATPGAHRAWESIRKDESTPKEYVIDKIRETKGIMVGKNANEMFLQLVASGTKGYTWYYNLETENFKTGWADNVDQLQEWLAEYVEIANTAAKKYEGLTTVAQIAEAYVKNQDFYKKNPSKYTAESIKETYNYKDFIRMYGGESENTSTKEKEKVKPLRRPRFDRVDRTGLTDYRLGKNITLKQLKETFGLADIHPGNYVTGVQLQDHSNYAYDSLMDLSVLLGWEPKQMGFGGNLHLAFGALGSGRHAAHYSNLQPVTTADGSITGEYVAVINLTNTKGDGTFLHEYFHGIDYMLSNGEEGKNIRHQAQQTEAVGAMVGLLKHRVKTAEELQARIDQFLTGGWRWNNDKKASGPSKARRILQAIKNDAQGLRRRGGNVSGGEASVPTQFYEDALHLASGGDYWANPWELFARAGEAWGYDQLLAKKQGNTYLVNNWVSDGYATKEMGYKGSPYPEGDERKFINTLYGVFVENLSIGDNGYPVFDKVAFDKYTSKEFFDPLDARIAEAEAQIPSEADVEAQRAATQKQKDDQAKVDAAAAEAAKAQEVADLKAELRAKEEEKKNALRVPAELKDMTLSDIDALLDAAEQKLADERQEVSDNEGRDPQGLLAEAIQTRGFDKSLSWKKLFELADAAYGGTQAEGAYTVKDAYDALEVALNRWLMRENTGLAENDTVEEAHSDLDFLETTINGLPTQTKRTAEQDEWQQFSTPPTIGYVMARVANIKPIDILAEPSAGTGNLPAIALATWGDVQGLILNEFNDRRFALLGSIDFGVPTNLYSEDAAHLNDILPKEDVPTVILMNPPFSATGGRMEGTRSNRVGMTHVEQALKRLAKGGRLVALVGQGLASNKPASSSFWEKIKKSYTVRANIGLSGESYRKFGTTFDNQLLVIDKVGPHTGTTLTEEYKGKDALANLKIAVSTLEGVRNERRHPRQQHSNESGGENLAGRGSVPTESVPAATGERGAGLSGEPGTLRDATGGAGGDATREGNDDTGGRRRRFTPAGVQPGGGKTSDTYAAGGADNRLNDAIAEAAKHGVTGISEALEGLFEIFGGNTIKSFPGGLDEESYAKAKPHFQRAWANFKASGRSIKDFFEYVIDRFGAAIKPYGVDPDAVLSTRVGRPPRGKTLALPAYRRLGSNKASIEVTIDDAIEVLGFDPEVGVVTVESGVMDSTTPMRYNLDTGQIEVNPDFPASPRWEAAQFMVEEMLHSVDVVGQQATISASSPLFSPNGIIFKEAMGAFKNEVGSLRRFLFYPLDAAWGLSQTEIQAELFARLGVLYLGDPQTVKEIMPNAEKLYRSVFASNDGLSVRQPVRTDTTGNRKIRGRCLSSKPC